MAANSRFTQKAAATDSSEHQIDNEQQITEAISATSLTVSEHKDELDIQEGMKMTELVASGHLIWAKNGLEVDVFTDSRDGKGADITEIKQALGDFEPSEKVTVTITEVLGRGDAWISLQVERGDQGQLLMATGSVINHLTEAGVCGEVLLTDNSGTDSTNS